MYAMAMMPIKIDGVTYNAGAGLMSKPSDINSKDGGNKSSWMGTGIPTAPLISQKPQGDTRSHRCLFNGQRRIGNRRGGDFHGRKAAPSRF